MADASSAPIPIPMAPTNPKPSKPTTVPSTSSWVSMAETFSCKKRTSTTTSSPLKLRNRNKVSLTSGNNNHPRNGHDPYSFMDLPSDAREDLNLSKGKLVGLEYPQVQAHAQQHENEDLLLTVIQLRQELEHLKDVLLEQQRVDAEKDKLIERLTNAVQGLHVDIPSHDLDRNVSHQGRQRSFCEGSPLHLDPHKFSGLRLSHAGIEYDDDDLV